MIPGAFICGFVIGLVAGFLAMGWRLTWVDEQLNKWQNG